MRGVWALITGEIPEGIKKFIFGKKTRDLSKRKTRLIGLFLISPYPLIILFILIITYFMGTKGTGLIFWFEIIYVLLVFVVSLIIVKTDETTNEYSYEVEKLMK